MKRFKNIKVKVDVGRTLLLLVVSVLVWMTAIAFLMETE